MDLDGDGVISRAEEFVAEPAVQLVPVRPASSVNLPLNSRRYQVGCPPSMREALTELAGSCAGAALGSWRRTLICSSSTNRRGTTGWR